MEYESVNIKFVNKGPWDMRTIDKGPRDTLDIDSPYLNLRGRVLQ